MKPCHQNNWSKNPIVWHDGDVLMISVVFTWHLPVVRRLCEWNHQAGKRILVGGTAIGLMPSFLSDIAEVGGQYPALQKHNLNATFTSRGCIRSCEFCAVPKIEGNLVELKEWEPKPVVCDNNILACSRAHFNKVIDRLKSLKAVDFNQGLDVRLLTNHHLERLRELHTPILRFAWDHINYESLVLDAIRRTIEAGFPKSRIKCYVLFGFKDTPEDALYRLETLKSLGIKPNSQRFQPLDALKIDSFVDNNWTEYELHRMHRYWSRQNWLSKMPYEDFTISYRRKAKV